LRASLDPAKRGAGARQARMNPNIHKGIPRKFLKIEVAS
jgi:hypothetical protein